MDISNFMSWFINQVISIFTDCFSILDSITFAGTSLLDISLTIIILGVLIPVVLTISQGYTIVANKRERIIEKKERAIIAHNREVERWERNKAKWKKGN